MQCVSTDNATLRYIGRLLINLAGSTHRRLANGGVRKSARTSVKNYKVVFLDFFLNEECKFSEKIITFAKKNNDMKCRIVNRSGNALPSYSTALSAGMDLRADLTEPITLNSLERVMVPTGILIELPAGFEAQVRPRSGLAIKSGITVINSPGTIDADYRGEVKVGLVNLSKEPFTIQPGDRIAQMVVARHEVVEWKEVAELSDTERGAGGFGSSGIH